MESSVRKQNPPMIIHHTWTNPDTNYLNQNIKVIEKSAFTGTVVSLQWPRTSGGMLRSDNPSRNMSWHVFGKKKLDEYEDEKRKTLLYNAAADLNDLRRKCSHFKDNFVELVTWFSRDGVQRPDLGEGITEEAVFDWFDDTWWDIVLHNTLLISRLAAESGLKGIFIDFEEYGNGFWTWDKEGWSKNLRGKKVYNNENGRDKYTYDEVKEQVYERGKSFIRVINEGFCHERCIVWMSYGWSHIDLSLDTPQRDLSKVLNGLLGSFVDGMVLASVTDQTDQQITEDKRTFFVDGCEGGYEFDQNQPDRVYQKFRRKLNENPKPDGVLYHTAVPQPLNSGGEFHQYRFQDYVKIGIAIAIYRVLTPVVLRMAIEYALKHSDGYVWIYSMEQCWWVGQNGLFPPEIFIRCSQDPPDRYQPLGRDWWSALASGQEPDRRTRQLETLKGKFERGEIDESTYKNECGAIVNELSSRVKEPKDLQEKGLITCEQYDKIFAGSG